jgi:hypothetical protein
LEKICPEENWESKIEFFVLLVRVITHFAIHRLAGFREESHLWGEWLWIRVRGNVEQVEEIL